MKKYKVKNGVYIYPQVGSSNESESMRRAAKSFVDSARAKLKDKKIRMLMSIKDIVKDNFVEFVGYEFESPNDYHENLGDSDDHEFKYYYDQTLWFDRKSGGSEQVSAEGRKGRVFYRVVDEDGIELYNFSIPFSELRGGRFKDRDKAIYFMRWIRKSMRK